MKHQAYFDEQQDVFFIRMIENITPQEFIAINTIYKEMKEPRPRKVIIDITKTNMNTWKAWDKETREKANEQVLPFRPGTMVAVVGSNPISRMIIKVTLKKLEAEKNSKFFKTEADALTWLKES